MTAWSHVLRNAQLVDGSGAEPVPGDLAVALDRIDAVGRLPHEPPPGAVVLDCRGLVVAPGFIDVHTHSDLTLLAAPAATTHLMQGVTTDICVNSTVLAAANRDYRVTVVTDGVATLWPEIQHACFDIWRREFARLKTTVEILEELSSLS